MQIGPDYNVGLPAISIYLCRRISVNFVTKLLPGDCTDRYKWYTVGFVWSCRSGTWGGFSRIFCHLAIKPRHWLGDTLVPKCFLWTCIIDPLSMVLWSLACKWGQGVSYIFTHNPLFRYFIRSKHRTWKKFILHASPWSVDPCSSGLALQALHKFLDLESQGGPHWFYFFTVVPPLINQWKKSCRVWESRPDP